MYIKTESVNEAFVEILKLLSIEGQESAPKNKKIKEIINLCVEVDNPRNRVVTSIKRKIDMAFAFGQLSWYLDGRNDLEMMEYYSKSFINNSDDGKTLNSAYGYRIFNGEHPLINFNQWENVKRILKDDNDSRQAIIHLHTPNDKKIKDEVCTLSLQFLIRDNKLNMITTMRSNDIYIGFTYDVFIFTLMQEILANELGVELGKYYHNVGSMHIYEDQFYLLEDIQENKLPEMKKINNKLNDFKDIISIESTIREMVQNNSHSFEQIFIHTLTKFEDELKDNYLNIFAWGSFMLKASQKMYINKYNNVILDKVRKNNETNADVLQHINNFKEEGRKIIIDGVDGTGKSTLSKIIGEEFNLQIQHYHAPSDHFGFYDNYMYNLENNNNTVFDRFFLSEIAYSKFLNRECYIKDHEIEKLIDKCKKQEAAFIFIIAKNQEQLDIVKNRLKDEDKQYFDKIEKMNKQYKKLSKLLEDKGLEVIIKDVE